MNHASATPVRRETVDLVAALVAIESVNPELDPGGGGEARIAAFIADWLSERGLEVEIDEPAPGRPGVIARRPGTGSGPSLLLTGHIDTVSLGGEFAGLEPRVEGERLYGRGSYDMKGGIAATLAAVDALRDTELAGDLVIGAVADEETRSRGTVSLLERIDVDAAIVTEPTALEVVVAHKGFAWFSVTTSGRAAHGSRPDEGRDAIAAMGAILGRLGELADRLAGGGDDHPLLGSGSVHASTINGGAEASTYPASCELRLERRTIPRETRAAIEEEIAWVASAINAIEGVEATARLEFLRDPFEVATDEPIVKALKRCAQAVTGGEHRRVGYAPWTDAALLAAGGVPTAVFGPGGGGAHADREWVELPDVEACAAILKRVAVQFCGRDHL